MSTDVDQILRLTARILTMFPKVTILQEGEFESRPSRVRAGAGSVFPSCGSTLKHGSTIMASLLLLSTIASYYIQPGLRFGPSLNALLGTEKMACHSTHL